MVAHSTEGRRGSRFEAEAAYLRNSLVTSAHYLVGQAGQIVRILDPLWVAWHAGLAAWGVESDVNALSVGVELHHKAGDPWPDAQLAALRWLVAELGRNYPTLEAVVSHRAIALPAGRKSDPTGLSEEWLVTNCILR